MRGEELGKEEIVGQKEKEIILSKRVKISENCAEVYKKDEANWLIQWTKEEGIEDFIGEIIGVPELLLKHVAGRVYEVRTKEDKHFFVVVGHGRPSYYPIDKEINKPEEILSYHRGRGLITRMKVNYLREERNSNG